MNCEFCNELVKGRRMRTHLICKHMWGVFGCHVCQHVAFNPDDLTRHILESHKEAVEEGGVAKAKCASCKCNVVLEDGAASLNQHYL